MFFIVLYDKKETMMLTNEQFDSIHDGTVFAKGTVQNSPIGIFATRDRQGDMIKWIAKKGYGDDWAIYYQWATHSDEFVESHGDKLSDLQTVLRFVPCEPDVMNKYRL